MSGKKQRSDEKRSIQGYVAISDESDDNSADSDDLLSPQKIDGDGPEPPKHEAPGGIELPSSEDGGSDRCSQGANLDKRDQL